jgi:hypothetical protein
MLLHASSVTMAVLLAGTPAHAQDEHVKPGRGQPPMQPPVQAPPQAPPMKAPPPALPPMEAPTKPREVAPPPTLPPVQAPTKPREVAPPVAVPTKPREVAPPIGVPTKPRPGSIDDDAPISRPTKPRVDPPAVKKPDTKTPDTKPPDVRVPDVKSPDVKTPDVKNPSSKPRDVKRPDVKVPDAKTPDAKTPDAKTPDAKPPITKSPVEPGVATKRPPLDGAGGKNRTEPAGQTGGVMPPPPGAPTKPIDSGSSGPSTTISTPSASAGRGLGGAALVGGAGAVAVTGLATRPERFISDTVAGVPVLPRGVDTRGTPPLTETPSSEAPFNQTTINQTTINQTIVNNTYNQYVTNISNANGWYPHSRWSSCGPCPVWQPYDCRDGLSVSVGFGSGGFSFGFFYGSSCAPLCSSWCNPWWDGYASYWTCAPAYCAWPTPWRSPCWRPVCAPTWTCWNPCSPWWTASYSCGPCPLPAWTPCYAYSPIVCATVVYTQPVAVPVAPPPLPNPSALWTFLAEGYDDDAENGFARLAAVDPGERAWFVGQGFARAFRGETAWASDIMREAFLRDPSSILRTSGDPRFVARLGALERSLSQLASGPAPSVDALLMTAASQAARGDLNAAYFSATSAQAEGDRSAGTASFIAWLRAEIRARGTP